MSVLLQKQHSPKSLTQEGDITSFTSFYYFYTRICSASNPYVYSYNYNCFLNKPWSSIRY